MAFRYCGQQACQVRGLYDFKEFVGGVVFEPPDFACSVIESYAFGCAEADYLFLVEFVRLDFL